MAYYLKLLVPLSLALAQLIGANPTPTRNASLACAALAARYPTLTSFPGSGEYTNITAGELLK